MRKLPHLTKNRYGVYCFRLIFTQSVRALPNAPQEISLSIETKDPVIAQERYMLLYPCARTFRWSLHESVMKGDIDVITLQDKVKHWKANNQLRALLATTDTQLFEVRRDLLRANHDLQEQAEHAARLRDSNQRLKGALKSMRLITEAPTVSAAVSNPTPSAINNEAQASPDALKRSTATDKTNLTNATSTAASRPKKRVSASQTLHAYVEKFLSYEEQTSTYGRYTKEARRACLSRFLDIVGYSVALTALTAKDIRHYRDMMHAIPSNFDKRGFAIPRARSARPKWFKDTIKAWNGATLSGSGIDTHFKHVRVFLTWAQHEHYLKDDFVSMLKVSKKRTKETKKEVVNFLPSDLAKLFLDGYLYGDTKPLRDNGVPWHFWIPLIALYTGMRSEEIGSLTLQDVVELDGLWCLQVTKSKTEAGIRTFPIPQRLLDAGFLEYRAQCLSDGEGDTTSSLFPTLKKKGGDYSNRIGQFFNRNVHSRQKDGTPRMEGYLYKCGVEHPSESQTLKFHSFRHGFITKWLESGLPLHLLKNIVGHKGDFKTYGVVYEEREGATEAYIHVNRVSHDVRIQRLRKMKEGMDSMDFGVDLSGLSYERFVSRK
ncbi:site-specific integrase [Vibrio wakamikoensis]|uniref:site-specific integrase n=1 Tax=Vibrio wakamikoensis TaxID=2910251 RepID=UPI003D1A5002